jgi:hypothetical protein
MTTDREPKSVDAKIRERVEVHKAWHIRDRTASKADRAAAMLDELIGPPRKSLRDVAVSFGVSYERVRFLIARDCHND